MEESGEPKRKRKPHLSLSDKVNIVSLVVNISILALTVIMLIIALITLKSAKQQSESDEIKFNKQISVLDSIQNIGKEQSEKSKIAIDIARAAQRSSIMEGRPILEVQVQGILSDNHDIMYYPVIPVMNLNKGQRAFRNFVDTMYIIDSTFKKVLDKQKHERISAKVYPGDPISTAFRPQFPIKYSGNYYIVVTSAYQDEILGDTTAIDCYHYFVINGQKNPYICTDLDLELAKKKLHR